MRATTREVGKLKLVHPGRHVEIHTKPIPAAEIMRRNPRHCITRPDVFENPWLVVKPEAILHPGKVFLIVPNHKIYSLLKANEHHIQSSSPLQNQSPKNHVHSLLHKHTSTQQSQSPQNHVHHQLHTKILPSPWEQNCHEYLINKEMVAMYKDSYSKFKEESSVDLMMRSSCSKEYYYRGSNNSEAAPKNDDGNFNYYNQLM